MKRLFVTAIAAMTFACSAVAQIANPYQIERQVAAPVPKLALLGAETGVQDGAKYSKIIFSVQNREKYDPQMFVAGPNLPPNPCKAAGTRIVAAIYSESGFAQTSCIPIRSQGALASFSYLTLHGKPVPKYVYAVLTDRQTGAAYRSNVISPWTGLGK